MSFHVIIPARFNSSRMPGKVLVDIHGKPMLQHVYEKAVDSGADSVIIATDDDRVAEAAKKFAAKVCMTSEDHTCGTERVAEAVEACDFDEEDIEINVQADEPFMPPKVIQSLAHEMEEQAHVKVGSVCSPLNNVEQLFNPNVVKVILNRRSNAMYFSRAPIPWDREQFMRDKNKIKLSEHTYFRHHGLYAYRAGFLTNFIDWQESPLEALEKLEQLRILWHGGRIHMHVTDAVLPIDVNTEEDLEELLKTTSSDK